MLSNFGLNKLFHCLAGCICQELPFRFDSYAYVTDKITKIICQQFII